MSPNPKGLLAAVLGECWAPHRKPGPGAAHICTGLADGGEELCQQPGMMLGPETAEQEEGVVRANLRARHGEGEAGTQWQRTVHQRYKRSDIGKRDSPGQAAAEGYEN